MVRCCWHVLHTMEAPCDFYTLIWTFTNFGSPSLHDMLCSHWSQHGKLLRNEDNKHVEITLKFIEQNSLTSAIFMNWTSSSDHIFSIDIIHLGEPIFVFIYPIIIFASCIIFILLHLLVVPVDTWCSFYPSIDMLSTISIWSFSFWLYFDMWIPLPHNIRYML